MVKEMELPGRGKASIMDESRTTAYIVEQQSKLLRILYPVSHRTHFRNRYKKTLQIPQRYKTHLIRDFVFNVREGVQTDLPTWPKFSDCVLQIPGGHTQTLAHA
jgi:hypothetical protein